MNDRPYVNAANADAWALGQQQRNGFHVRRVVWGRIMADAERRPHEQLRRARILIRLPLVNNGIQGKAKKFL